ncbi:MAG: RNB domain-containing ribonuclease [Candidatus Schekmanbacteria bacterium]|nr:RNB domain-containing ribonuclease [Candidatus Schekmanbacteria bacterium]
MLHAGRIIEYADDSGLICALCLESNGTDARVLSRQGRTSSIRSRRILHVSAAALSTKLPMDELVGHLRRVDDERRRRAQELAGTAVAELWELLATEPRDYALREICEYLDDSGESSETAAALLRALNEDRIYFKLTKGLFFPNAEDKVAALRSQLEAEARREREERVFAETVHGLREDKLTAEQARAALPAELIARLVHVAVHGEESPELAKVSGVLGKAGIRGSSGVFDLLVRLGVFTADENLFLRRFEIPTAFPGEVLAEVQQVVARRFDAGAYLADGDHRVDLRALYTFSIDDASTLDVDDAFSVTLEDAGEVLVHVHITNAAIAVPAGSALDLEARCRATSIYLPEGTIPMLPEEISTGAAVLVAGCDRPALTLAFRFRPGGELADTELFASVVRVDDKLTYDDVNARLPASSILQALDGIAQALERERIAAGALLFNYPEMRIKVLPGGDVELSRIDTASPGFRLVREFMILTNRAIGEYCMNAQIPALFRQQAAPDSKGQTITGGRAETETGEFDPVLAFVMRRTMGPTLTDVKARPHFGLGVAAYAQFSSPARRYRDLLLQQQLSHVLDTGEALFDEEGLKERALGLEQSESRASQVARGRREYWMIKALQKHGERPTPAIVVDTRQKMSVIFLTEYLMEARCSNPGGSLSVGDRILVRIEAANPRRGQLVLVPVGF